METIATDWITPYSPPLWLVILALLIAGKSLARIARQQHRLAQQERERRVEAEDIARMYPLSHPVDFRPGSSIDLEALPGGAFAVAAPKLGGWVIFFDIRMAAHG